ncbi:MAG: carbohydrate binding domain-containing protein, partial [Spirochaetaceae bacterium]|nr:carbohydrate binding domain-containing protein [Spirochaetaceae bacterium]
SYFQWMDNALQPNITMIETYEDDGGPDPSGGLDYVNPGERPVFTPDYRKMRFGLATALLNDGFFSYEINTNGHGYLGLLWFDEYDNAGEGKGYLGQPLGPAYRLIKKNMGRDLLENRNASVILSVEDGSSAEIVQDSTDDVSHVAVHRASGTDWHVSSIYSPVSIRQDKEYSLTFEGRSDSNRTISAWLQQNHSPWTSYLQFGDEIELTPYWQNFELSAVSDGVGGRAGLFFGLGRSNGDIWLKEVQIHQGSREVWRRDFTGGIVLLNASNASIRLELEDSFQRIDGTQDRKVNNGAEVTILTLPSHDGLILLRP